MPDLSPRVQVPGFRDRFGERVIVPQPSGSLLEYLHFAEALADAPFFAPALKYRVARLSSFAHSSYCRVRRVQPVAERGDRLALVSSHVASRRLAEVLEVAGRANIRPATAGVLAVTRQMMASIALLHDFAPDGFHGAIGPERLLLASEGRVVIAEHVLGTVINQAVEAWGAARVWQDLGVATLTDPALAPDGRRNDVLQLGLVVLAMLLGRPIGVNEYPGEIGWLIQQAAETTVDGATTPLEPGLRKWLERVLRLAGDSSFATLLDAQKALAELLQSERHNASRAAWDSFVSVCETAALRVTMPAAPVASPAPAAGTGETPAGDLCPVVIFGPEAESSPQTLPPGGEAPSTAPSDVTAPGESRESLSWWPAAAPSENAATLLEKFTPPAVPEAPTSWSGGRHHVPEAPPWAADPPGTPVTAPAKAETLFRSSPAAPGAVAAVQRSEPREDSKSQDVRSLAASSPAAVHPGLLAWPADGQAGRFAYPPRRRIGLMLALGALLLAATAAVVQGPRLWAIVFDPDRSSGRMTVYSDPAGASVTVDGLFRGTTPVEVTLPIGSHQLDVQNGGSIQSKTISIGDRDGLTERMTFPGGDEVGGLAISTYPARGRITVDGVPRGLSPVNLGGLTPGSHTVAIETSLGSQEQDVIVKGGALLSLAVQTVSWIKVEAPYALQVSEDGRVLGTTGSSAVVVSPGRHHLEFSNQALGVKLRQSVVAVPGQLGVVPLELPMGTMNLTCDEPADVFVDGQSAGVTPVSGLAVPLGPHVVTFQNVHGRLQYKVSATLAGPVRLAVAFRKQ